MAGIEVKMLIGPFKVVRKALSGTRRKIREKIIALNYDEKQTCFMSSSGKSRWLIASHWMQMV